jgi:hypothetical protein
MSTAELATLIVIGSVLWGALLLSMRRRRS